MQIRTFDQFEFGDWESEAFLALAKEDKGLRGADFRIKDIHSFYEVTERYECFSQWQTSGIEKANVINFSKGSESVMNLIGILKDLADTQLDKDQIVYFIHSDWNLVDFIWEDELSRYRVMWCMTA